MSTLEEIKKKKNHELTYIEYLIVENENKETTETIEAAAAELAAKDEKIAVLRERVEQLEASNARLFDDLHNQIHQTVGAEMERDELREQVADVNELLWEFTEYPNIELGEKGHNKIEDYFKKYDRQEAQ